MNEAFDDLIERRTFDGQLLGQCFHKDHALRDFIDMNDVHHSRTHGAEHW